MLTETITKSSPLAERIAAQNELIDQLKQQIKEQQEKKKELLKQQRAIDKLIKAAANLEVDWSEETVDYIWESLASVLPKKEERTIVIDRSPQTSRWLEHIGSPVKNKHCQTKGTLKALYLEDSIAIVEIEENVIAQWPVSELELDQSLRFSKEVTWRDLSEAEAEEEEEKEEELVNNPTKKNTSNSFFAWQPTSNPAVSTYFNIKSGRTQAAYFGASNKRRLAEMETKLMRWFPGVSCCIRMAQRMTDFKYELKVVGFDRVSRFG